MKDLMLSAMCFCSALPIGLALRGLPALGGPGRSGWAESGDAASTWTGHAARVRACARSGERSRSPRVGGPRHGIGFAPGKAYTGVARYPVKHAVSAGAKAGAVTLETARQALATLERFMWFIAAGAIALALGVLLPSPTR